MKKLLLTTLALAFTIGVYAQGNKTMNNALSAPNNKIVDTEKMQSAPVQANKSQAVKSVRQTTNQRAAAISVVPMGNAANTFTSIGARTQLFAMPSLNTVGFIHRSTTSSQTPAGLGSGYFLYDVSMDGGATWSVNNGPIFDPTDTIVAAFANGRYPQGLLYNPVGNTDPMNAYWSWHGPTLTGLNGGSWGSYAYGSAKLDGSTTVQRQDDQPGAGGYYQVADDMANGLPGEVWVVEPSINLGLAVPDYIDSLMVRKGVWNAATSDFDYTDIVVPFPVSADADSNKQMAVTSVAFDASGQTGYIVALAHLDYTVEPDSVLTICHIKTTDGGATWSAPAMVDISSIVDPILQSDPNGSYTTAFEAKTAVDINGNLHVACAIGPDASGFSIGTTAGEWGVFDIYTTDGGTTWEALLGGTPQQFRGTWDPGNFDLTEDSRPYLTTSMDHEKVFLSWLDTDSLVFGTYDGNSHPDLWMIGLNTTTGLATLPVNLTAGTAADGEVSYGVASKYAFEPVMGTYEIPYCYMINDPTSSSTDMKPFNYIKGIEFTDADFVVGIDDIQNDLGTLTGAYPNP
ncbi:MAG: hypothetical protein HKO56_00405, partial [Bacteroidia bacterium]|nr:hypothetical protein [Bacteroidia bacterium]